MSKVVCGGRRAAARYVRPRLSAGAWPVSVWPGGRGARERGGVVSWRASGAYP